MFQDIQAIKSVLNLQEAMGNLDGDAELLQEILEIFLEVAPEQLEALDAHIQSGRNAEAENQAHSLKGSASNFCAVKFVETSYKLEQLARDGSLEGAEELMGQLRTDFAELQNLQAAIDWEEIIRNWSS